MGKNKLIIFLFLVLVSFSFVSAEECYLRFDDETYVSLVDLDNYNRLIPPIENQFRQNDYLFVDKIHIKITNPYYNYYCDFSNYSVIEINIREAGSNVSHFVFSYVYQDSNITKNTIDISLQKENLTISNREYFMNNKEILNSDAPFMMNETKEYQVDIIFIGNINYTKTYYSPTYQPNIPYSPSLKTYTFRVLPYTEFENIKSNKENLEFSKTAIKISMYSAGLMFIALFMSILSLITTLWIFRKDVDIREFLYPKHTSKIKDKFTKIRNSIIILHIILFILYGLILWAFYQFIFVYVLRTI